MRALPAAEDTLKGCTRPRQFAQRIFALPTAFERRAALERVPAELRSWVEQYLRDWWIRQHRDGKVI